MTATITTESITTSTTPISTTATPSTPAATAPVRSIWHETPVLDLLNALSAGSLVGHLGIEFIAVDDDSITARMPVDERTRQPMGILHGGASVALAETLASFAATLTIDRENASCVGVEINANHLRPVSTGWVTGVVSAISLGRRSQVWEIRIASSTGELVCISRCTIAVVTRASRTANHESTT